MPSSVVSVRPSRATSSRWEMIPSRCAATALHMYAPMLVVDVCTLVVPSALRMSAGNPEAGSVIAAIDAHVVWAYRRSGDELARAGTAWSSRTPATSKDTRVRNIDYLPAASLPRRNVFEPGVFMEGL